MRRDFVLGEDDTESLAASGHVYDTIAEGAAKWVVLRGFSIPAGYNVAVADAAVRLGPSYPDEPIDMVYFYPSLALLSNRHIGATQGAITLEGKRYQQWSRHRTAANPWRPGLDSICTHLLQVTTWLERELGKG
ncbi:E2/UBC family protein [Acidicapsa acidisoli]|uniref:E2/UBC family protein n=1 Tax=Acidicapsa acidisoli TaxID=1615681 RepID=UPI0021DFA407|nr:E2/UBC family protein [Acidicapsa acidisoli]